MFDIFTAWDFSGCYNIVNVSKEYFLVSAINYVFSSEVFCKFLGDFKEYPNY